MSESAQCHTEGKLQFIHPHHSVTRLSLGDSYWGLNSLVPFLWRCLTLFWAEWPFNPLTFVSITAAVMCWQPTSLLILNLTGTCWRRGLSHCDGESLLFIISIVARGSECGRLLTPCYTVMRPNTSHPTEPWLRTWSKWSCTYMKHFVVWLFWS